MQSDGSTELNQVNMKGYCWVCGWRHIYAEEVMCEGNQRRNESIIAQKHAITTCVMSKWRATKMAVCLKKVFNLNGCKDEMVVDLRCRMLLQTAGSLLCVACAKWMKASNKMISVFLWVHTKSSPQSKDWTQGFSFYEHLCTGNE